MSDGNLVFFPGVGPEDLVPAVWETDDGAERVLRSCLDEGMSAVAVVGVTKDGRLSVWSSTRGPNEAIGLFSRGIGRLQVWADSQNGSGEGPP